MTWIFISTATTVMAAEPLPYEASFEESDGLLLGTVAGQRGWSVDQGAAVVAEGEGMGGSRALRLEPSDPTGQISLTVAAGERGTILYSDFLIRPAPANPDAGAFADAAGAITGFFRIGGGGELFLLNGDGQGGGEWLPTGVSFATDDAGQTPEWIRLSLRQDFLENVWDVFITDTIYHDQKSTVYTYQLESGLLSTVKFAKDTTVTLTQTYYRDGNLYRINYDDTGTPDVYYYYDSWYDRMTYRTDGVGTTNYTYKPTSTAPTHPATGNGAGQLATVDGPWPDDTITYTYDDLGRLTNRTLNTSSYPIHSHSNALTFDSLGRLTQDINGLATYKYTFIGNSNLVDTRKAESSPSVSIGVGESDYDYLTHAQGRFLQRISHKTSPGGTVISQHDYTYGTGTEHGQIKTWQRQLPNSGSGHTTTTQTFGYDATRQLLSGAETGQPTHFYNYDPAGNRTSKSENNTTTNYAAANSLNQIPSATGGGDAFNPATYDHNGNLTSIVYSGGSRRLMTWDGINRLKQLTILAGATQASGDKRVLWTYNADSQRATESHQTFNGSSWTINTTYYFIWEDGRIVQRRDNGTSAYICTNYYPEGEIRCYAGTTSKYYHTHDHLGSVYELTTTAGAVQAAYSFTPYGERSKRWGGAATDIAYTGHWNLKPSSASHPAANELSLTWFRAYDPKRGVWLSRDPWEEYDTLNIYQYVRNSPTAAIDILGLGTVTVGDDCRGREYLLRNLRYLDEHEQPKVLRRLPAPGQVVQADAFYGGDGTARKIWGSAWIHVNCVCRRGKWMVVITSGGGGLTTEWKDSASPPPWRWPGDIRPYRGPPPTTNGVDLPPLNPVAQPPNRAERATQMRNGASIKR